MTGGHLCARQPADCSIHCELRNTHRKSSSRASSSSSNTMRQMPGGTSRQPTASNDDWSFFRRYTTDVWRPRATRPVQSTQTVPVTENDPGQFRDLEFACRMKTGTQWTRKYTVREQRKEQRHRTLRDNNSRSVSSQSQVSAKRFSLHNFKFLYFTHLFTTLAITKNRQSLFNVDSYFARQHTKLVGRQRQ